LKVLLDDQRRVKVGSRLPRIVLLGVAFPANEVFAVRGRATVVKDLFYFIGWSCIRQRDDLEFVRRDILRIECTGLIKQ